MAYWLAREKYLVGEDDLRIYGPEWNRHLFEIPDGGTRFFVIGPQAIENTCFAEWIFTGMTPEEMRSKSSRKCRFEHVQYDRLGFLTKSGRYEFKNIVQHLMEFSQYGRDPLDYARQLAFKMFGPEVASSYDQEFLDDFGPFEDAFKVIEDNPEIQEFQFSFDLE